MTMTEKEIQNAMRVMFIERDDSAWGNPSRGLTVDDDFRRAIPKISERIRRYGQLFSTVAEEVTNRPWKLSYQVIPERDEEMEDVGIIYPADVKFAPQVEYNAWEIQPVRDGSQFVPFIALRPRKDRSYFGRPKEVLWIDAREFPDNEALFDRMHELANLANIPHREILGSA